ncbi:hypothetical protein RHM58_19665 [Pseudomonas sp. 10S4]|uniref:acyltransferase family protein n=1 Tax=Pseudomonas sp. 10S4 TaxID=3048583 RepID=UPI002AC8AE3A|nr:acyltransferase family protein [Pseudomonas sp. 10S4]WPX16267.1 hypothetical protein RHM58_19665 [Pseudomonas sp. 10S4]
MLSGFILSHVYSVKGIKSYFGFVRDRASRIWPMHIFALVLLFVFVRSDVATYDGVGIFSKLSQLRFNVLLLQSITPFDTIIFSWNSVSWSISTELFFYLAFPLLLVNIKRTWFVKLACSAAISILYACLAFAFIGLDGGAGSLITPSSAIHANPIFRGFEFCLGISSWVIWDKYIRRLQLNLILWSIVEVAAIIMVVA